MVREGERVVGAQLIRERAAHDIGHLGGELEDIERDLLKQRHVALIYAVKRPVDAGDIEVLSIRRKTDPQAERDDLPALAIEAQNDVVVQAFDDSHEHLQQIARRGMKKPATRPVDHAPQHLSLLGNTRE